MASPHLNLDSCRALTPHFYVSVFSSSSSSSSSSSIASCVCRRYLIVARLSTAVVVDACTFRVDLEALTLVADATFQVRIRVSRGAHDDATDSTSRHVCVRTASVMWFGSRLPLGLNTAT